MLSIRLKEKWHAIIATAGAARLRTARRNGPTVSRPGWLAGVACYQHERVIVALHLPGDDGIGDLLRRIGEHERLCEAILDAVGVQNHGIAQGERHGARRGTRLLGADESGIRDERDARRAVAEIGAQQHAADVADAEPRHRRSLWIEIGEAKHHPPQSDQRFMAAADEIDERLAGVAVQRAHGRVRSGRGVLTVAQAIHDGDERPFPDTFDEREVAGFGLPRQRQRRERRFDFQIARRHFFMVIVVPCPTTETTSNSSIRRFAPGRPAPTPCEVEYPYCIARSMSGMPGPWSLATTETPWRSPFCSRLRRISPFLAYIRMLRAISEMAAAMTVCSPLENPATAANARPCCLASTTSTSAAIDRRSSSPTGARLLGFAVERALFGAAVQEGEALFEVQDRRDALQGEAELHHRERHVGLNAHDDRLGTAQAGH